MEMTVLDDISAFNFTFFLGFNRQQSCAGQLRARGYFLRNR